MTTNSQPAVEGAVTMTVPMVDTTTEQEANPADGQRSRVDIPSTAVILRRKGRVVLHTAQGAVGQRLHRIVQQPATKGVPQAQPLDQSARSPSRHRRLQGRAQHTAPPLSAGLPDPGRVRCPMQPRPHTCGLRDQLRSGAKQPGSKTGSTDYRGPAKLNPTHRTRSVSGVAAAKAQFARPRHTSLQQCAGGSSSAIDWGRRKIAFGAQNALA
jgi:hypothetical protein